MSLFDVLTKESYDGHSFELRACPELLGETMQKLMYTEDDDTYCHLYNEFNNYAVELTISPKSSPRLFREACCACGTTKLLELHEQYDIMMKLIEELISKYKINILGTVELYKDKVNLHCHCIMNNYSENRKNNIKKYIKDYYQLYNPNVVNLNPIKNKLLFRDYLIKSPYGDYFYHNELNEKNIAFIEREVRERKIQESKNKCKCQIKECSWCKSNSV